jgi:PKHD-type hydroxylase
MPSAVILSDIFSREECRQIIETGLSLQHQRAEASKTVDDEVRKSKVAWFHHRSPAFGWIHQRMAEAFHSANARSWNFELDGAPESSQFTIYKAGDYFDWHTDVGDQDTRFRKLSSIVQLNDLAEYDGGILQLHVQKEYRDVPKQTGSVVIFPAYTLHRVTRVTSGVRYSLVSWSTGSSPYR